MARGRRIPEVFTTAHDAVFTQCGLPPGSICWCMAGRRRRYCGDSARQGGGRNGHGDRAQRLELRDKVRSSGRDNVIDPEGFEEHGPYDVILELVGGPNMPGNFKSINTDGRIVVIGVGGGFKAEVNLLALMGKRAGCADQLCARGRWKKKP